MKKVSYEIVEESYTEWSGAPTSRFYLRRYGPGRCGLWWKWRWIYKSYERLEFYNLETAKKWVEERESSTLPRVVGVWTES